MPFRATFHQTHSFPRDLSKHPKSTVIAIRKGRNKGRKEGGEEGVYYEREIKRKDG